MKLYIKNLLLIIYLLAIVAGVYCQKGSPEINNQFLPFQKWKDSDGVHINAHGGGFLYQNGIYYWYGEFKTSGRLGNTAQVGVSCYTSTDLYNWKNEGVVLKVSDNTESDIQKGCVIERPKVIYNAKTGKYVMWFHLELKGRGYEAARTGVAVSDNPKGPFSYLKSYRPNAGKWPVNYPEAYKNAKPGEDTLKWWTPKWYKAVEEGMFIRRDFAKGQMSRDMNVFVDDDGKAYHIHAAEENLSLHISELTDDYLDFTGKWIQIFPAGHNEAPALCKTNGKYYLITSGCTGWDPNAARSAVASSIWGPWESLGNPCRGNGANITYGAQSTYILKVAGKTDQFIFIADKWEPKNPIDGTYLWLPLGFEDGKPILHWQPQWNLKQFASE